MSQSFYKSEQLLSEASKVSLPSRRQHWMNTRLRTKLRAERSQPHYQHFDYSTLELDDKPSGTPSPSPLILRTWTNPPCLPTYLLSLDPQIQYLTSLLLTAYLSCFLTTSSRAHRHYNCCLQTTHKSNPRLVRLPHC